MSSFGIFAETIGEIIPHPNADRLDLATLLGIDYTFVVPKGQYKQGDLVIYFPLDAILPQELLAKIGLVGKLGGNNRNRVKTIKLRGQISQGIVAKPSDVVPEFTAADVSNRTDFAEKLGIIKYDPEDVNFNPHSAGGPGYVRPNPLPSYTYKYDIENAEKYKAIVDGLMEEEVYITEKLEGCHVSMHLLDDGTVDLCSRNCKVIPTEGKSWHELGVENTPIESFLRQLRAIFTTGIITIRGEVVGPPVMKNIYKLDKLEVKVFEIEVNSIPINAVHFYGLVEQFGIPTAPLLFKGKLKDYLNGKTVKEASNGVTVFGNDLAHLREGIVIKPSTEIRSRSLGRVFLKQRSPQYLEKADA